MRIILFEDAGLSGLGPLAQTRPVFELRCGAVSLRERAVRCLAADEVGALVRPELAALARFLLPGLSVNAFLPPGDDVLLVNGRWLAPAALAAPLAFPQLGIVGDRVAYAALPTGFAAEVDVLNVDRLLAGWRGTLRERPAGGAIVEYPWDLVENNALALEQDERWWRTNRETVLPAAAMLQGPRERLFAAPTSRIEPFVLIDTTNGPVIVDDNVLVQAFSRIEGPCYIGPDTQVNAGGRLKNASIGPQCRIGGEVETSIVQGLSNKAHEGFLGHSFIGEWVNFGSGTQTSDLRNDYENISVPIDGRKVETGLLKVGSFVGDHVKTTINTAFNTGSVCGPFAMLATNGTMVPHNVPAFAQWSQGRMTERTDSGRMFRTAETMLGRRGVTWAREHHDFFLDLYERTGRGRRAILLEREQRLRRA